MFIYIACLVYLSEMLDQLRVLLLYLLFYVH